MGQVDRELLASAHQRTCNLTYMSAVQGLSQVAHLLQTAESLEVISRHPQCVAMFCFVLFS